MPLQGQSVIQLEAAFHFGSRVLDCPIPGSPDNHYTTVWHAADSQAAHDALAYDALRGYGFEIIDRGNTNRNGAAQFGPLDNTPNNRNRFSDTCPEEIYDSLIGFKDFATSCSALTEGSLDIPCDPPEGGIFRVDVPNGLYRFVLAVGDAFFSHAHRVLAEDGGSGPPAMIDPNHVTLISNHDQAQYTHGQARLDRPGAGVFGATGFPGHHPPAGDGIYPDPVFVYFNEEGLPTGQPRSPILQVTQGYVRIHLLQGNSNPGPNGEMSDPNGGDIVLLELWRVSGDDVDQDGLSASEETQAGTNPWDADSDNDKVLDGHEIAVGTNPLDPESKPVRFTARTGQGGTWNVYELSVSPRPWWDAHSQAISLTFPHEGGNQPGHLAFVESAAENAVVQGIAGGGWIWIGLTDDASFGTTEGTWVWTDGTPASFFNWSGGQPDNFSIGEDAVHLWPDGYWNDSASGIPGSGQTSSPALSYVIEYDLMAERPVSDVPIFRILPEGLPGPLAGDRTWGLREVRGNGELFSLADAVRSLSGGQGEITDGEARALNHADPDNPGAMGIVPNDVAYLGDLPGADDDHVAFLARGRMKVPANGFYTLGVHSDDGAALRVVGQTFQSVHGFGMLDPSDPSTMVFTRPTGDTDMRGVIYLESGVYELEFAAFESLGGSYFEVYAAPGAFQEDAQTADWTAIGAQSGFVYAIPGVTGPWRIVSSPPDPLPENVVPSISSVSEALVALSANTTISFADAINFQDPGFGSFGSIPGDVPFPRDTPGINDEDFAILAQGTLHVPQSGLYDLGFQGDDGGFLRIVGGNFLQVVESATGSAIIDEDGQRLICDCLTANSRAVGRIMLTEGEHQVEALFFERAGGSYFELFGNEAGHAPVLLISGGAGVVPGGIPLSPVDRVSLVSILRGHEEWKYNTECQDGTGWEQPGFDDTDWQVGPGGFTGGETDPNILAICQTKTLPAPSATSGSAAYFRTHFEVPYIQDASLVISCAVDDAAVFYLNGVRVQSLRMPNDPAVCGSLGGSAVGPNGDAQLFEEFTLSASELAGILQPGDNVLAVSVHQDTTTSSDMVFVASVKVQYPLGLYLELVEAVPEDHATLRVSASDGLAFEIESSENLNSPMNWRASSATPIPDRPWHFLDAVGPARERFYRAEALPVERLTSVGVDAPAGLALIANPLNNADNNINTIMPLADTASGTTIWRFDSLGQSFRDAIQFIGFGLGWLSAAPDPNWLKLPPGEAVFIQALIPLTHTFTGELAEGYYPVPVRGDNSWNMLASPIPQEAPLGDPSRLNTLGFPAVEGDLVFLWNEATQQYAAGVTYVDDLGWVDVNTFVPINGGAGPILPIAHGFWVQKQGPLNQNWDRSIYYTNP